MVKLAKLAGLVVLLVLIGIILHYTVVIPYELYKYSDLVTKECRYSGFFQDNVKLCTMAGCMHSEEYTNKNANIFPPPYGCFKPRK